MNGKGLIFPWKRTTLVRNILHVSGGLNRLAIKVTAYPQASEMVSGDILVGKSKRG